MQLSQPLPHWFFREGRRGLEVEREEKLFNREGKGRRKKDNCKLGVVSHAYDHSTVSG